MKRPRLSTIYVKKRAVKVERAPVARPSKWRTVKKVAMWHAGQASPERAAAPETIVDEVTRCLAHGPIAFPRKLWGEVL